MKAYPPRPQLQTSSSSSPVPNPSQVVTKKLATSFYKGLVILVCWMFWWNRVVDPSAVLLAKEQAAVASYIQNLHTPSHDYEQEEESPIRNNLTIFYHTFAREFPEEEKHSSSSFDYQRIDQIVQEQIHQVGKASQLYNSEYTNQSLALLHFNLLYTTVGIPGLVNDTFVQSLCRPYHQTMTCQPASSSPESNPTTGHEEVTLSKLRDYCRAVQHPQDEIVAYIHTKGSLHPKVVNHEWRRHLTQAAVSPQCIQALLHQNNSLSHHHHYHPHNQCNVCGLQFLPIWIQMYPGNFFSARCDYIRQLLPLEEHATQMQHMTHTVRHNIRHEDSSIWQAWIFPWIKDSLGVDRWSREAWVGSHPHLRPCDMADNVTTILQHDADAAAFLVHQGHVQAAPRVPGDQGDYYRRHLERWKQIAQGPVGRRPHEYFMLPGTLFRTYQLYGQFPPSDSWIWKWFPHGAIWREKVEAVLYSVTNGTTTLDRPGNTTWLRNILNESMLW